ncbi:lysophospholipid acyltransferase family protein [Hyphomicrobium sp.]|uniref:lysophospholipid acyltransferase family protein n=1 Tax=Hyphomicrobium sp. TaxID=82 RepID=UPI002E359BA7|nr:lysophospholipid acyltransferase family protein [Hyphomicrobium sp.]HEX2842211.1 lysophospholipid acyltransferase family protein [Hyphomicrobium sp.]
MGAFRATSILAGFFTLTVPLMPVQALLLRVSPSGARRFPNWYHRRVCRLFGIKLHIDGAVMSDKPVLLISNHTSWLDIPVLSAVAPLSFVAKKEVGRWPFVSSLARLQRTVFVDRERRSAVGETTNEIMARLATGDTVVLFAEGTSSDGNRVLPFKTSLFAAAKPPGKTGAAPAVRSDVVVQTLSIVYTRLHGVPINRSARPMVGWFGDMEMQSHAWELLKAGPLDVRIRISPPIPLDSFADRKDLARRSEDQIRENVVRLLRGYPDDMPISVTAPAAEARTTPRQQSSGSLFR